MSYPIVIVIDSREKSPLKFSKRIKTTKKAMETGDYTLAGFESLICVERKSRDDLLGCLTSDLARFRKQLERLSKYKFKAVVVEGTVSDIYDNKYYCNFPGHLAMERVLELSCEYKIPFYFTGTKYITSRWVVDFLTASKKETEKY